MPRILSLNNGPFSISSSVLSLEKENLEKFFNVSANTFVIDEGESVRFDFQYRNIKTEETIYWEIISSSNITYEDFNTLMNGTFQVINSGVEGIIITANKDFTNINQEITENFNIRFRENNSSGNIIITSTEIDILDTSYLAVGQQEYTTPGTYNFTVPKNVNKISFILIGGGGGQNEQNASQNGASGGALIYCNNLYVQEGQNILVVVGDRGASGSSPTTGGTSWITITTGGVTSSIIAEGGRVGGANIIPAGGSFFIPSLFTSNSASSVGRTGGKGGRFDPAPPFSSGGAGSAAGYSANGVDGGRGGLSGSIGQGGSGGSGAGSFLGAGGGTGIYGIGDNGLQGIFSSTFSYDIRSGKAGSKLGSTEVYSQFGGGSAGGDIQFSFKAGTGAVRIIWPGQLRQYPSTRTADETPIS
jgi:hypothetical protein